jgi:hypothetical protein
MSLVDIFFPPIKMAFSILEKSNVLALIECIYKILIFIVHSLSIDRFEYVFIINLFIDIKSY